MRIPLAAIPAPAALCLLAGLQIALAQGAQLSPWKGGGFGMFSTTDHGGFRRVRVIAERTDGEDRVRLPADLARARRHARELPTAANLRALVAPLRAAEPALATVPLRIEVWRLHFAPDDLRPEARRIAVLAVP